MWRKWRLFRIACQAVTDETWCLVSWSSNINYISFSRVPLLSVIFVSSICFFSRKYDTWACEILTFCHRDRRSILKPHELLTRVLPNWGNVTCLYLADTAENLRFLTHPVVKSLLDEKWENGIIGCGIMQSRWRPWNYLFEPLKVLVAVFKKITHRSVNPN